MAAIEDEHVYGLHIRESATDGSDFANADADYRRLFVGEDGLFHLKDSAGVVTDPYPSGSGIAATIFDAKGDLIAASAADTAARLAVGAAGDFLTPDTAASTGLRWNRRRTCRKTGNEALSSTSYADSTNMALAIEASKNYAFRYVIFYTTNATSVGIKLALKGPASCTCYAGIFASITLGTLGGTATMVAGVQASGDISTDLPILEPATGPGTTATMAVIEGILNNGANAGNLVLRHASETATATTILVNSYGELIELA